MTETTERVIYIVGLADGSPSPAAGQYIKSFKPGGPGNRGHLVTTSDIRRACVFTTPEAAFEFYRQARGIRADGKPNRPLTAFTIEVFRPDTLPLTGALTTPPPKDQH